MLKKRLIKAIVCLLIPALVVDPLSGTAFAAGFQLAGIPIVIPSHYGTLTDSWTAAPSPRHPTITPPCVVIIQDLHANPSVQRNIAEIVKSLARSLDSRKSSRENRFLTVFVEGAQGPFDVSILRHVAIGKVKKLAVQKFLDEAKVTGAEIAAIEAKEPIHLWGVDEKDLYLQNLQDFYQASRKSPSPIPGNTIWSRYYSTARQRDIPLTLNSLAHLDLLNKTAASSRLAVVVAGGYHTEGITHLLKANHVSYAVVTPVVGELGHERVYAARLRSLAENAHKQALVVALGLAVVGFSRFDQQQLRNEILAFLAAATLLSLPAVHWYAIRLQSLKQLAMEHLRAIRGIDQPLRVTSGIKNRKRTMAGGEKVLFEGSLSDVVSRLESEGRVQQALTLKNACNTAISRYPELRDLPIQFRITEGHPTITSIEGKTVVIENVLLEHFELLRQELASEEFGHLLAQLLTEEFEPGQPATVEQRVAEELHTDIKKLEDFLKIRSVAGQAALVAPLIYELDEGGFYGLLLRVLPAKRTKDVIEILKTGPALPSQIAQDIDELKPFDIGFDRRRESFIDEIRIIDELIEFYRAHRSYFPEFADYLATHTTSEVREALANYRQRFNRLRSQYHMKGEVPLLRPFINLGGIEVRPGKFLDQFPDMSHQVSSGRNTLILKRKGKELLIRKRDNDMIDIGNQTYALGPANHVDLYDLIITGDEALILSNNPLLEFFGLTNDQVVRLRQVESRRDVEGEEVRLGTLRIRTSLSVTVSASDEQALEETVDLRHADTDKILHIRKINIGTRSYLVIGQRAYRVRTNVVNLDALLSDPLMWLGNVDLVEFFGFDSVLQFTGGGSVPEITPIAGNARLRSELVPPEVDQSIREAAIKSLNMAEHTLILMVQTDKNMLSREQQMRVLHDAAIVGGLTRVHTGRISEPEEDLQGYETAMRIIRLFLGPVQGREKRLDKLAIQSAYRLSDFLTMVQYGFDGIREREFVHRITAINTQLTTDPDAMKRSNWYFNQPVVPGMGKAIALEPLPTPDRVSREPIAGIDQLRDRFIVYEESLGAFIPDGDEVVQNASLVAILPAAGSAARFGKVPKATYKVIKILRHAGGAPRYLSFLEAKLALVRGLNEHIPVWVATSFISNQLVRQLFSDLPQGPSIQDRNILQEVSRRFRKGTAEPLIFDNGQMSLISGVGHASNIIQILLHKELLIEAFKAGHLLATIGNIDNIGQRPKKAIFGLMWRSIKEGKPITVVAEISRKERGDAGGIPVIVTYASGLRQTHDIDLREQVEYQGIPPTDPNYVNEEKHFYFNPANYYVYLPALLVPIGVLTEQDLSLSPESVAERAIHGLERLSQAEVSRRARELTKHMPTYIISRRDYHPLTGEEVLTDQPEQMIQNYLFRLLRGKKLFVIGPREGAGNVFTPTKNPSDTALRQREWLQIMNGNPVLVDGVQLNMLGKAVEMTAEEIEDINMPTDRLVDQLRTSDPAEEVLRQMALQQTEESRRNLLMRLRSMMTADDPVLRYASRYIIGKIIGYDIQNMLEWYSQAAEVIRIYQDSQDIQQKQLIVEMLMSILLRERTEKPNLYSSASYVIADLKKFDPQAFPIEEDHPPATPGSNPMHTVIGNRGWFSYWAYYSAAKHLYEGATKLASRILGITDAQVVVTRRAGYVKSPLFNPATHTGWIHRARDVIIAASGPLASLTVAALLLWAFVSGQTHSLPLQILVSFLGGIFVVPHIVLGLGNMLLIRHPGSRIYRILEDLHPSGRELEQPDVTGWPDPRAQIRNRQLRFPVEDAAIVLKNKSVLVTGAGGNVAGALLDKLIELPIKEVILFDFGDKTLARIKRELEAKLKTLSQTRGHPVTIEIHSVLSNLTDIDAVVLALEKYRPQVVFHLAAYTLAPVIAENPKEGVQNNVIGTWYLLSAMRDTPSIERFVFVSSHMASWPAGIYEKTKRTAEMLVRNFLSETSVRFSIVRLVNIWEESPALEDFTTLVREGQKVLIKSPAATRYFMRRDEAASLLLTAVSKGSSGEIFVPDTGKPFRIVDLAKMAIEEGGKKPVLGKNYETGRGRGIEIVQVKALHEDKAIDIHREGSVVGFKLPVRPVEKRLLDQKLKDLDFSVSSAASRDPKNLKWVEENLQGLLDDMIRLEEPANKPERRPEPRSLTMGQLAVFALAMVSHPLGGLFAVSLHELGHIVMYFLLYPFAWGHAVFSRKMVPSLNPLQGAYSNSEQGIGFEMPSLGMPIFDRLVDAGGIVATALATALLWSDPTKHGMAVAALILTGISLLPIPHSDVDNITGNPRFIQRVYSAA